MYIHCVCPAFPFVPVFLNFKHKRSCFLFLLECNHIPWNPLPKSIIAQDVHPSPLPNSRTLLFSKEVTCLPGAVLLPPSWPRLPWHRCPVQRSHVSGSHGTQPSESFFFFLLLPGFAMCFSSRQDVIHYGLEYHPLLYGGRVSTFDRLNDTTGSICRHIFSVVLGADWLGPMVIFMFSFSETWKWFSQGDFPSQVWRRVGSLDPAIVCNCLYWCQHSEWYWCHAVIFFSLEKV